MLAFAPQPVLLVQGAALRFPLANFSPLKACTNHPIKSPGCRTIGQCIRRNRVAEASAIACVGLHGVLGMCDRNPCRKPPRKPFYPAKSFPALPVRVCIRSTFVKWLWDFPYRRFCYPKALVAVALLCFLLSLRWVNFYCPKISAWRHVRYFETMPNHYVLRLK